MLIKKVFELLEFIKNFKKIIINMEFVKNIINYVRHSFTPGNSSISSILNENKFEVLDETKAKIFSNIELDYSQEFIVFDTETSGLENRDQVLELAAVKIFKYGNKFNASNTNFHAFFPLRKGNFISVQAKNKNKISEENLNNETNEELGYLNSKNTWLEFLNFIGKNSYLVGFNVNFDLKMVNQDLYYWNLQEIDYTIKLMS